MFIYTHNDRTILWDETDSKTFYFHGNNLRSEFKKLLEHLEKAGLNKTGPLLDICLAVSDYSTKSKQGRYIMRFEFYW